MAYTITVISSRGNFENKLMRDSDLLSINEIYGRDQYYFSYIFVFVIFPIYWRLILTVFFYCYCIFITKIEIG